MNGFNQRINNPEKPLDRGTKIDILPKELIRKTFEYIEATDQKFVSYMEVNKDWHSALLDERSERLWENKCRKFYPGRILMGRTWERRYHNCKKIEAYNAYAHLSYQVKEEIANVIYKVAYARLLWIPACIGTVGGHSAYKYFTYNFIPDLYNNIPDTHYIPDFLVRVPVIIMMADYLTARINDINSHGVDIFFLPPTYKWHDIFRHLKINTADKIKCAKLVIEDLMEKEKTFCEKSLCTIL